MFRLSFTFCNNPCRFVHAVTGADVEWWLFPYDDNDDYVAKCDDDRRKDEYSKGQKQNIYLKYIS